MAERATKNPGEKIKKDSKITKNLIDVLGRRWYIVY